MKSNARKPVDNVNSMFLATSARTTSPAGRTEAPGNTARLLTAGSSDKALITASLIAAGDQILKCSIRSVCTRR